MGHTRHRHLVRRQGDRVRVYPRGDLRHGGAVVAAWGIGLSVALGAGGGALALVSSTIGLQLVIAAAISACVGFVGLGTWRVASASLLLDPEADHDAADATPRAASPSAGERARGTMRLAHVELPFARVRAVRFGGRRQVGHTDHGVVVELVLGDEALSAEQLASPADVHRLAASSVSIALGADASSAWVMAETIARTLRVPLVDGSGEPARVRLPHELDHGLAERLRGGEAPAQPEGPPGRMQATLDDNGLRARWQIASGAVALTTLSTALLLTVWLVAASLHVAALPLLLGAILSGVAALASIAVGGRFELKVDGAGLTLARPWRRPRTIALEQLDAAYAFELLLPKLLLVSRGQTLTCRTPSANAARWLSQAVQWALWRVEPSDSDVSPYR